MMDRQTLNDRLAAKARWVERVSQAADSDGRADLDAARQQHFEAERERAARIAALNDLEPNR